MVKPKATPEGFVLHRSSIKQEALVIFCKTPATEGNIVQNGLRVYYVVFREMHSVDFLIQ